MGERQLTPTGQICSHEEIVGNQKIGSRFANEWIREKLHKYREEYQLQLFETETGRFEIFEISTYPEIKTIVGQITIGTEAVGFISRFIRGELNSVTVILDLEGVLDWVTRGRRGEKRHKVQIVEDEDKKLHITKLYNAN